MAKSAGKRVSVKLTPMVKFYIGVAFVVATMVAIFVAVLVPMFKKEESLQRRFDSAMREWKEMRATVGQDPDATIDAKSKMIETMQAELSHLADLFPESPKVPPRMDPQIFLVEEYHELRKTFFEQMTKANMVVSDQDYLSPPSGALDRDALDVAHQVHKLRSINALSRVAIGAQVAHAGSFKVQEETDRPWETPENLVSCPVEMDLICTFDQLMEFLYRLDHAEIFFAVAGLTTEVLRLNEEGEPVLRCHFRVQAPYLKPKPPQPEEMAEESA